MEISNELNKSEFVSGSSLSFTCTIQPQGEDYVDTPTTVMSSWNTPDSNYDGNSQLNETNDLYIAKLKTADSGEYACSAKVVDSSGARYVMNSKTADDFQSIAVSK